MEPETNIDIETLAAAKARMAEDNPWARVEFDPAEADAAGAFREEAIAPEDAEDAALDGGDVD